MQLDQRNSYAADVSDGLIENESFWYKFGEGEVDTELTTLWSGATTLQPGLYKYPDYAVPGTAVKLRAKSTSTSDTTQTVLISGLDKHWKMQTEELDLNGTTYVETVCSWMRVFRVSVIRGSSLAGVFTLEELAGGNGYIYAHIEDGNLEINQTQMAVYSVPAGYTLFIKKATCTKSDVNPIKMFMSVKDIGQYGLNTPFRVQLNYNAISTGFTDETPHPFKLTEKTDFEVRAVALSVAKASDVAINLYGHLTRVKSVPVTPTTFTATAGNSQVVLTWDALTDSEIYDCIGFEVSDGNRTLLIDKSESDYTFTGLTNDTEYTFTIRWVGYDHLKSDAVTDTATPTEA